MNITKNPKTIAYIIIAILVVLGGIYSVNEYQKDKQRLADLSINEIKQLDLEEQKRALEARIKSLEKEIQALAQNADTSARYAAHINLAEAKLELGDYSGALSSLDSIPEEKKTNSRVLQAYGLAYKGLVDTSKAKGYIDQALALDDTDPKNWLAKIELNSDLPNNQLDGLYRQAIVATKSNVDVMISYARFSERIGNKDQAVAAWETAINVNPEKEAEYRAEIARLRQ
jgi:tetratricopeptide (TPR) repeat protein